MRLKISGGTVVGETLEKNDIYVENGKIVAVTNEDLSFDEEIDARGMYVSAGWIDIHSHGGGGYDFTDGGSESIINAARMHLAHGTTSIYPTSCAASFDTLKSFLKDVSDALIFPTIRGAHLEGPYFSKNQSGAQNPEYIVPIDINKSRELLEYDVLKRWDFAPELDKSEEFSKLLEKNRIVGAIAHSDAVYDDVLKVYEKGTRLVTHLYSATSTITRVGGYRRLGIVESTFLLDDMVAEVIADSHHLPPKLLEMIIKIKGVDKLCLVTDSMRAAGMPDGEYIIGNIKEGLACIKEDGVAKLCDRSAFAGSVATADCLVRTVYKKTNTSLCDAVKMLTINPARVMGLINKGVLEKGKDADIVIFDDDINVNCVLIEGKKAFENSNILIW